jgi:predicted transcriptional regulator
MSCVTREQINAVLEAVRTWPHEDQEELAEIAREIEARRTRVYAMNDDERAAVREGLDQARRGEFMPDDEMDAFWKTLGVP